MKPLEFTKTVTDEPNYPFNTQVVAMHLPHRLIDIYVEISNLYYQAVAKWNVDYAPM